MTDTRNVLTMDACRNTLATIDVTRDGDSIYAEGEVGATGGNIYLYIDGREFGSLFVHYDEKTGEPIIQLGQFDTETQQWEERHTLRALPPEVAAPKS